VPEPQFSATGIDVNQSFDWTMILPYLDKSNELRGVRVVVYDGYNMMVLREGPPTIGRDCRAVVIKPNIGEFSLRQAELAAAHEGAFYRELNQHRRGVHRCYRIVGRCLGGWRRRTANRWHIVGL
jgi:hypothetical protein